MESVSRVVRIAIFVVVGVLIGVAGAALFSRSAYQITAQTGDAKNAAADFQLPQTEQIFLSSLTVPEKSSEWWAARADHRLLAQSVFNCEYNGPIQINSMPRQYYRLLLLDLTPSGDHAFAASGSDADRLLKVEKEARPFQLDNNAFNLLALSDSIARARIAAAEGASVNVPWVQRLGIATVIISALATLFVTLQGRMRPVELDDGKRKEYEESSFGARAKYLLIGPGAGFRWVAFFAISLSIAGTSLAGLKQVYDPSRTLTQNTRSLLELRQLHQEVALAAQCAANRIVEPGKLADWVTTLRRIRAAVLPEYGAYAAIDLSGAPPRPDGNGGRDMPQPPTGNGDRPAPPATPAPQAASSAPK